MKFSITTIHYHRQEDHHHYHSHNNFQTCHRFHMIIIKRSCNSPAFPRRTHDFSTGQMPQLFLQSELHHTDWWPTNQRSIILIVLIILILIIITSNGTKQPQGFCKTENCTKHRLVMVGRSAGPMWCSVWCKERSAAPISTQLFTTDGHQPKICVNRFPSLVF